MRSHQSQIDFLDGINGDSRVTLAIDYYHKIKIPSTFHGQSYKHIYNWYILYSIRVHLLTLLRVWTARMWPVSSRLFQYVHTNIYKYIYIYSVVHKMFLLTITSYIEQAVIDDQVFLVYLFALRIVRFGIQGGLCSLCSPAMYVAVSLLVLCTRQRCFGTYMAYFMVLSILKKNLSRFT